MKETDFFVGRVFTGEKRENFFTMLEKLSAQTGFTPYDLEIYIGRKLSRTPLPLVYFRPENPQGHKFSVHNYILADTDHLVGFLFDPDKILHLRAFTKKDAEPFLNKSRYDPRITPNQWQIKAWVDENFNQFIYPRIPEGSLLNNYDVLVTLEILKDCGVKVPNLSCEGIGCFTSEGRIWLNNYQRSCPIPIPEYLEKYGDLCIISHFDSSLFVK